MPNLIAHLGVGASLTRLVMPAAESRWVYVGCLIPDVPWILQRLAAFTSLDPFDVRVFATAQASLICSLVLCAAVAFTSNQPLRVLAILSFNSLLHLLLDGCQTKWGNGVHLVAPVSWRSWNSELFWPESPVTYLLTICGAAYVVWDLFLRKAPDRVSLFSLSLMSWLAVPLLAVYFTLPLLFAREVEQANCHYVATLRAPENRKGKFVEFDRVHLEGGAATAEFETFFHERVKATGRIVNKTGVVSVRGRFTSSHTVDVAESHQHHGRLRDWASWVGLVAVALSWTALQNYDGGIRISRGVRGGWLRASRGRCDWPRSD